MRPLHYLFTFLLICLSTFASAQGDSSFLARASQSLSAYSANNPVEKVYLHTDRSNYYPGDTIWFKAYAVAGEQHRLSAISGVLYCELVNGNDSVVVRRILKMIAGITWGEFTVPRTYKPGKYHIRAYTSWMRNAGPEYFFNQPVRLLGAQAVTALSKSAAAANHADVQFFPEGGQLVNGLRSRVAVKVVNANGLGENLGGVILDNDGTQVASFNTQHLGMGVFALTPAPGKTYKAKITAADSSQFTVDLPPAIGKGYTLTLNNSSADSIYVKVAANNKQFAESQNGMFYLVAQCGGKVYYTAQAKLSAPVFTAGIAKRRFPSGIVQFTLFSQAGEPLNERVVFVQNNDGLNIKLSSDSTYKTRQKVTIGLDTKSDTGKTAIASLSVSVINESRVLTDENAESTILNNLLLTSDLKGYIEQPNYYFINVNDQKRANLDLLMLTQGYRRFEWKQIVNPIIKQYNNQAITYQPESDLQIEGTLKTPSGKPLPKGKITLLATRDGLATDTVTDVNGRFRFSGLSLSDTAKIILRARKANNGSNVNIYVQQGDYPAVLKSSSGDETSATLTPEMLKNIADYQQQQSQDSLKGNRQLKEVKIKAKKGPKPDRYNEYGTALEYDADMKKLRTEQIVTTQALADVIPGLTYSQGRFGYRQGRVRVIIDGFARSQDAVDFMSPDELESVRVIDAVAGKPVTMILTTKRYAHTDTASTVLLKTVTINGKKEKPKPDMSFSSNLHGGGNADQIIMGDDLGSCVNLSDCLVGRVFGVTFGADGTPHNNRVRSLKGSTAMSVIIDGIILPGSSLNDLNKDDIYSIEVLRSVVATSIYGSSIQAGGALVITTRHSGPNAAQYATSVMPAGLISYPFQGYHKARVFYSPKYDHPKTEDQRFDFRSTIYWNPNIITGRDGKASFEYYNADTKGTYRIVVEGIDEDGKLGRAVYRYKVE